MNPITASSPLGGYMPSLVAGHKCNAVVQAAAQVVGVKKVLVADAPHYANQLAENVAALVVSLAGGYSHILAPATAAGKNTLPRVAALLDVAQISDVIKIESVNTFVRPIYAGNVLATCLLYTSRCV